MWESGRAAVRHGNEGAGAVSRRQEEKTINDRGAGVYSDWENGRVLREKIR